MRSRNEREKGNIIIKDQLLNRIIKNSSIIFSGNLAASSLGFISFAIMANSLGPELLAVFALAQVYALIMNDLFNVQTWESLIKFGAKTDDEHRLARTIKTNLLIDIVSAFFAFTVALLLVETIGNLLKWDEKLIELAFFFSFVIPFTLTTFTIGIPRLFNKFAVVAKIQLVMAVLKLTSISIIGHFDGEAIAFIATYIIIDILVNISLIGYSLVLVKRNKVLDWRRTSFYLNREQIRFLWWTNLRTIVRIPVRKLDILIISQVMSIDSAGIYKVYKEIVGIIGRLGEPINQAIYPEYAKLLGRDKTSETIAVTKSVMKILLSVSAVTMVVFLILSDLIIARVFGDEYLSLIVAFYVLVILNCANLFLTPINSLFIAAGFAKFSFYIVLFNNILYLFVAVLGGMYFGIYGIVLAFAVQIVFNQGSKLVCLMKYSTGWGNVIR